MRERMKRHSPQMLVLCWAWIVFCAAFLGYGYATYSGLYRWLAELQVSLFGKYAIVLSGVLPVLILAFPAMAIIRQDYLARDAGRPNAPRGEAEKLASTRRSALILMALSPLCFIVAGAAYWIGMDKAVPAGDPVRFDLRRLGTGPTPMGRVTIRGNVLVDRGITTLTEGSWQTFENFYAPLIPVDQSPPESSFQVFVKRSSVRSGSQPRLRQMFLGTETGILIQGGLPPEVRAILAKNGVQITEPHWLLAPPNTANDNYYAVAGLAALIGLILLLSGGAALLGARTRARRL